MKIEIIAICNLMGRPASVREIIETKNEAEEEAAQYLISIGKAKDVTPVIAVEAVETEADDASTSLSLDVPNSTSTTNDLTPAPSLHDASRFPKRKVK